MPQQKLNINQIMTIGAKELAILEVPNGCIAKSRMRIPHVDPTITLVEMLGCATSIPWIAPSTD